VRASRWPLPARATVRRRPHTLAPTRAAAPARPQSAQPPRSPRRAARGPGRDPEAILAGRPRLHVAARRLDRKGPGAPLSDGSGSRLDMGHHPTSKRHLEEIDGEIFGALGIAAQSIARAGAASPAPQCGPRRRRDRVGPPRAGDADSGAWLCASMNAAIPAMPSATPMNTCRMPSSLAAYPDETARRPDRGAATRTSGTSGMTARPAR
jgi:hypothetical protein